MQKNILFSGVVLGLLLAGCGDETPKNEVSHAFVASKDKTLFPKSKEMKAIPNRLIEKVVVKTTAVVPMEKEMPKVKRISNKSQDQDALTMAKSVASVEIAKAVSTVEIARSDAARVITGAVADVETGALEDRHNVEDASGAYRKQRAHTASIIIEEVADVQKARAASAATIASSVKLVDAARAAKPASSPMSANSVEVVKAASAAAMARSVASVEIAKAKAASNMANATALVEVHSRVYGDGSPEVKRAEAIAGGMIAKSVGNVNVAQADALGEISQSVAAVEVAKAKAGILDDGVEEGKSIYLKHLKSVCPMNGAKFAALHTQAEWKQIVDDGKFAAGVLKECPKLEVYDKAWSSPLILFVQTYASDSGNVPSCH